MGRAAEGRGSFHEVTASPSKKPITSQELREMAERILPSEVPAFVAGAILVIRFRGETPNAKNVMAELVAEGKTKAQLKEQAA